MADKQAFFGVQNLSLYIDNRQDESKLDDNDDINISTASNFQVSFSPTIELQNMLFLKSADCEETNTKI